MLLLKSYQNQAFADDVLGLMLPNTPEFICAFLGLNKIGVTASFLNVAMRRKQLVHTMKISKSKIFIVHPQYESAVLEVLQEIPGSTVFVWGAGGSSAFHPIASDIAKQPTKRPSRPHKITFGSGSIAAYIFTSGTTGLSKAAKILNIRVLASGSAFQLILGTTASDRICVSSPLYHASASNLGLGMWVITGATLVLIEKFSASSLFKQLVDTNSTMFLYVGEMCRYLLSAPASEFDRKHRIRVAFGNGLRGDVWGPFKRRYALPHISEFYAATESPATLMTLKEKEGSMGRIPMLFKNKWNLILAKYDRDRGELYRDPNTGMCAECGFNEVGQILGKMPAGSYHTFHGYTEAEETGKKIARDVLAPGDAFFATGDLARMDRDGCFFFVDRVGDTFRWKGQNVSTTEVEHGILSAGEGGILEAAAYGPHSSVLAVHC